MKFEKKDSSYILQLSEKEFIRLGLTKHSDYEIIGVKNKIWILLPSKSDNSQKINLPKETSLQTKKISPNKTTQSKETLSFTEKSILAKISTKNWADLVCGKFEKSLTKEELPLFKTLLEKGKIKKFKKPNYKNSIYQLASAQPKDFSSFKSNPEANIFAKQNHSLIKEGKLKGIKDFDGTIYFISSSLLNSLSTKILELLPSNLENLAKKLNKEPEIIKAVLVFLTEEGQAYQPSKNQYAQT